MTRERRREDHGQEEETPQLPALTLICDILFYHRLSQKILFDANAKADATNLTIDAQESGVVWMSAFAPFRSALPPGTDILDKAGNVSG